VTAFLENKCKEDVYLTEDKPEGYVAGTIADPLGLYNKKGTATRDHTGRGVKNGRLAMLAMSALHS
jgi:hypothetical protein